jgi:pteridine reductase
MQDRAVLVTGAARRIGAAIARQLHASGARVALHYHRSRAEADALAAELNAARSASCTLVQGDLLDVASLARIVAHAGASMAS